MCRSKYINICDITMLEYFVLNTKCRMKYAGNTRYSTYAASVVTLR